MAIGDRSLGSFDQLGFLVALGRSAGPPHDAVGAAVIAAVLHLEEETRAGEACRSAAPGGRREGRCDLVEDLTFERVRKHHVDTGDRRYARVRIVDMATRENQLRIRVAAPEAVHHGSTLAAGLGRHRAAVDHADVGALVAIRDSKAGPGQPVAELGHLGEIDLAPKRLDGDVHRCWTRIAAATTGASRARRIRGPRFTATAPRARSTVSSTSVQPPSGPTAMV